MKEVVRAADQIETVLGRPSFRNPQIVDNGATYVEEGDQNHIPYCEGVEDVGHIVVKGRYDAEQSEDAEGY